MYNKQQEFSTSVKIAFKIQVVHKFPAVTGTSLITVTDSDEVALRLRTPLKP